MEISEVKVKLMRDRSDRLKAFCSITIDKEFVIRDLKIIEGTKGMFVAMPSRKITDKCQTCGAKNHLKAKFCNECGGRLDESRANRDADGRAKVHADIAHPINSGCRERMQAKIVEAYDEELAAASGPDYRPRYDSDFDDDYEDESNAARHPHREPVEETPAEPELAEVMPAEQLVELTAEEPEPAEVMPAEQLVELTAEEPEPAEVMPAEQLVELTAEEPEPAEEGKDDGEEDDAFGAGIF